MNHTEEQQTENKTSLSNGAKRNRIFIYIAIAGVIAAVITAAFTGYYLHQERAEEKKQEELLKAEKAKKQKEKGIFMIIKNVSLETVCGITSKLPENIHPEVAFAGKSNVGKSSLINGLMNRKSLARTSAQPGKTQTINYYNVNDEIYFVDLPGYGYAQANENVKAQWGKMIEDYLHKSKQLKLVFLLIDIRHAPSENDRIMYDWIRRNGYDPIIIATKLDKINRSQIQKQIKLIRTTLQAGMDTQIIPYSAQTKQGREEIYEILDGVLAAEDPAQE